MAVYINSSSDNRYPHFYYMKKQLFFTLALLSAMTATAQEEIATSSQYMTASPTNATSVTYSIDDPGKQYPIIWGLDTAWPDEWNMRRGTAFIGTENLGTARVSFQPSDLIVNGQLSSAQQRALDNRLRLVAYSGVKNIALNCDHEVLMTPENPTEAQKTQYAQHRVNYVGKPAEWVKLFEATARYCQSKGYTVVSISPFNEPDYGWNQGSRQDFYNIIKQMRENPFFDSIRISGGNTLNCDQALPWYNALKEYLDEGNTHQLAGEFNTYASFFETVHKDGKHGTADELHNVMEAMVGVEYGMQTGIWWGFDGLARGEFCRASNNGDRLAYAENRSTWTAASVYRNNKENKVQAFLGSSERQASNASYRFVSRDRYVCYDGYGPVRDFVVDMPGGTGYQKGQTNAERVVNITWGEDVQPYIKGDYVIQNKGSKCVLTIPSASSAAGAKIVQKNHSQLAMYQQWDIQPVDSRIGGDFSYYSFRPLVNTKYCLDVLNSSLSNNGTIIIWDSNNGAQQQWYLQYAGDGYFYIRSRHSTLCLRAGKGDGASVKQNNFDENDDYQLWRFVPAGERSDSNPLDTPTGLTATAQSASIRLDWTANTESDLAGYTILRAELPQEAGSDTLFNTIARGVQGNAFLDNNAVQGVTYLYKVKAQDLTGNYSAPSEAVKTVTTGEKGLIGKWQFDGDLTDLSVNQLHGNNGGLSYLCLPIYKSGTKSLSLNGTNQFVQLPHEVATLPEMTICTWVRIGSTKTWQRIFDFGNGTDHYMFLTPIAHNEMRFVMKNGGEEEILSTTKMNTNVWYHVAVSIGTDAVTLYLDGKEVARSTEMKIRPCDIRPTLNYIARSQFSADPYLQGYIDDFRIYNYALNAEEIAAVTKDLASSIQGPLTEASRLTPVAIYTISGTQVDELQPGINLVKYQDEHGRTEVRKIVK